MNRRSVLKFATTFPLVAPLFYLAGCSRAAPELLPVFDQTTGLPLLRLAPGFSYHTFGWAGEIMATEAPTPDFHDGMAVVPGKSENEIVLLRNHECYDGQPFTSWSGKTYDQSQLTSTSGVERDAPGGGVTALTIRDGVYVGTTPVLSGTMVNCAGGPTPWGTWLSCEEIVYRRSRESAIGDGLPQDHGYVFETLPPHLGETSHNPIKEMGLMRHEAAAVDPATGHVYLTEDNYGLSGFYKFVPDDPSSEVGALERGGKLYMLKVANDSKVDLIADGFGTKYNVEWVPIAHPDADPEHFTETFPDGPKTLGEGMSGPFWQGTEQGGATFNRGEGCWYHDGVVYFIDTSGGPTGNGSVWAYEPAKERLSNCFSSTSESQADAIDNLTINPANGTIILCEDGGGVQNKEGEFTTGSRLLSANRNNRVRVLAENNVVIDEPIPGRSAIEPRDYRSSEWAGATFSPDGSILYANIQDPGITFAIEGPWLDSISPK